MSLKPYARGWILRRIPTVRLLLTARPTCNEQFPRKEYNPFLDEKLCRNVDVSSDKDEISDRTLDLYVTGYPEESHC